MPKYFWTEVDVFITDASVADAATLAEMRRWAQAREHGADRTGMGRSPKARRMFRQMRIAAEAELERRGRL